MGQSPKRQPPSHSLFFRHHKCFIGWSANSLHKMSKFWTVTTVSIIVDNFREEPFWLKLKDYRQCNLSALSLSNSIAFVFFYPPIILVCLLAAPLYMITKKTVIIFRSHFKDWLYGLKQHGLVHDWILLLTIVLHHSPVNGILGKFNSRLFFSSKSKIKLHLWTLQYFSPLCS